MLMLSDLLPIPLVKLVRLVRRALLLGCIGLVIGFAGVVTGRTTNRQATVPAPIKASAELLHDAAIGAADEHIHPNLSMPEIVTGVQKTHTRVIWMEVTAYCACPKCCGPKAKGITASGKLVSYNDGKFVAADTSVLPFGTKLLIPGYDGRPVEVIDRGSAIKGEKLDVFYASHDEARRWGRQRIPVTVID
jgi:3D (Asp-Asp-Asp) domain-containing protein